MTTAKTEDHKGDLEAKKAQLESDIKTLEEGIAAAKAGIAQNQLDLQRATEDRKVENMDYQRTMDDQAVTIEAPRGPPRGPSAVVLGVAPVSRRTAPGFASARRVCRPAC